MKSYTKSQFATEFIVLASLMLLALLVFFAITSSRMLEAREENNRKISEDIANVAYREIEIAKSMSDGYTRLFLMPKSIDGVDYTINITDNRELLVNYSDYEYVKFLPSRVIGNITKGLNRISKINDIIYINGSRIQVPLPFILLIMKNSGSNVIDFYDNGSVILKGNLQENHPNPPTTGNDEFVFKDRNGNNVAVVNLNSGNMFIKGTLYQKRATLIPPSSSNDFVVSSDGKVVAYIDENGNFYLKGIVMYGNP